MTVARYLVIRVPTNPTRLLDSILIKGQALWVT